MSVSTEPQSPVRVQCGPFQYLADVSWSDRPQGFTWTEVTAVATDSHDRVFIFVRGEPPVLIFDAEGTLLESWGRGVFTRPHGLTIGPDDRVYCVDDFGHTIRVFTAEGNLLLTLGQSGRPSNTGATSIDYRTITHAGPPFNFPTNVAVTEDGDIFAADGYGNARIHHFSSAGELLHSWGEPGNGPGQFHVPHGIAIDPSGRIFVADRENSRIQIFSQDGEYQSEMRDIARPCQIAFDAAGRLFVAELVYRSGMWPGTTAPAPDSPGGRLAIYDSKLNLLGRLGGGRNPTEPGDFFAPHDVCVDSRGNVYVAEVVWSAGANRGHVSPDCHSLQQFRAVENANEASQ